MKNGGAAETKEFDALAVEEKMEMESQKSNSSICIKFLLDFGTFHKKEFTLLRNTWTVKQILDTVIYIILQLKYISNKKINLYVMNFLKIFFNILVWVLYLVALDC